MNYNMESPKLELKLNLSPSSSPPRTSVSSMELSPQSSCVSKEPCPEDDNNMEQYPSSPETTSMMLVGCPRCLMYVMLSDEDPKCPKCKSTVLLDFFQEERTTRKSVK
ncbi:hypothetical protein Leryth_012107 [Lithospermum erythrorhizon]|uniref:GIR1-like zinc ribbon domain-containing protein n=1 Tax=Lithospermum erythrorhizon TaxID=34254 RepID=A0AAV3QL46_LITER|nr:hypothetical protein Leryth_012107 [Lithospermum erythrorhizon]